MEIERFLQKNKVCWVVTCRARGAGGMSVEEHPLIKVFQLGLRNADRLCSVMTLVPFPQP